MPRSDNAISGPGVSGPIIDLLESAFRSNPKFLLLSSHADAEHEQLLDEFKSERIRTEQGGIPALTSAAIGAALCGYRPIIDLGSMDELALALEPLAQTGKTSALEMPLVIRIKSGNRSRNQSWESWCTQIPGLYVATPATLEDSCVLLHSALHDQAHPVILIQCDRPSPFPAITTAANPLGKAAIHRPGKDLTVVSYGRASIPAFEACQQAAAKHKIDAEMIDLRTLVPLDLDCVLESLKKTGRLLLCADAPKAGSVVSELAMQINENGFDELDAPMRRVCEIGLGKETILSAIRELSIE
jgi:pyruvate dehydrogenase E1 component beta subunit